MSGGAICIQTQLEEEFATEDQQRDLKSGLTDGKGYCTWKGEAGSQQGKINQGIEIPVSSRKSYFPSFSSSLG